MKSTKIVAAVLACLVLAMAFVTGCSDLPATDDDSREAVTEEPTETAEATEEPTPEPTEEPSEEPEESALYKSYGTGDEEVLFTNNTDLVFKSLQIQGPDETEYAANLMSSDSVIPQGETFAVKYTPVAAAEITPDPEEEILFNDNVCNLKLTTNDGKEYILYDNDFTVMDTAFIKWDEEGDVLYLEFQNTETRDIINTLEAQLFMKDFAAGAIDETPAQEARAAAEATATKSSSGQSSSSGGSHSNSSSSGSGSSGSSGSGSSSSGGGSTDSDSSSSDSDSSGGGSSDSDDWSSGDAGTDDCLEDNIVWLD